MTLVLMNDPLPFLPVPVSMRLARLLTDEKGMSTIEYAMGSIAAAALAAVLYAVVRSPEITDGLRGIIERAINSSPA